MVLTVSLAERSYPVLIDEAESLPQTLQRIFPGRRFALVTNTTIAGLYAERLTEWESRLQLTRHTIPDGEEYKTLATWSGILDTLLNARLDRSTVLIAFGGGVVGDITGFAAAAFLRGIDYVQVPTTLLAMVDSSVGGKTAVDHPMGKNLIGAFHQPRLVVIDTNYLTTLPEREFLSGYAEVFKYGFIGGREMFDFILQNHEKILAHDPRAVIEAIHRSIAIKAAVVGEDERESGKRALLNFGHTFGHALEKFFGFQGVLHGEAIWWGMAGAIELGLQMGTIAPQDASSYTALSRLLLRPTLATRPPADALYDSMFSDKKVHAGKLRFVLPSVPGESIIAADVPVETVRQTLQKVFATV
jgi:3-dehydroquinate synthase